jgi:DNA-binding NarL/FixJ family response regulator
LGQIGVIDVLIVDDHTAVRAGLLALLRGEPGIVPVGAARGIEDALVAVEHSRPDVALVDYDLVDGDGLTLCHELKSRAAAPRVLIYSAFAHDGLSLAARVAGADGLLSKGVPPEELFDTIRSLAAGRLAPPAATLEEVAIGAARLDHPDLPIFGMLMDHTPHEDIAAVLGLSADELDARIRGMLGRLAIPARAAS